MPTQTIVDDGNALGLSAGQPTVLPGSVTIVDNGNAISLSAGQPHVQFVVKPLVTSLGLSAGTPKVKQRLDYGANTIDLAFGLPSRTGTNLIIDDGNSLALAAGQPTVSVENIIRDDGNAISLAAGTPTVQTKSYIVDNGNAIGLSFGSPIIAEFFIEAQSAPISLSAGTPKVVGVIKDATSSLGLSFGSPIIAEFFIEVDSAPISLSAGTPTVAAKAYITDLHASLSLNAGTPQVIQRIDAASAPISLTAGTPHVQRVIKPLVTSLGLAYGLPTVLNQKVVRPHSASLSLEFGRPHIQSPQSVVLLAPISDFIGQQILIASTRLSDTSRNDTFTSIVDPSRWTVTAGGSTNIVVNNGVAVELLKNGGGSSYQLVSTDFYSSGDITLEYDLLSDYLANTPASELVYVGLEMQFLSGEVLTIKRKVHPGFNGQQVQAVFTSGGAFNGGGTFRTTESTGKLRLIKHEGVVAAVVDDQPTPLFLANVNPLTSFSVRIFSTTNGQNDYLKSKYKAYKSNTGVLLGTSPLVVKSLENNTRVIGLIPPNKTVGLVDVTVFNHYGQIGQNPNGFEYPLVLGQSLSSNGGFNGNVQGDAVVRN